MTPSSYVRISRGGLSISATKCSRRLPRARKARRLRTSPARRARTFSPRRRLAMPLGRVATTSSAPAKVWSCAETTARIACSEFQKEKFTDVFWLQVNSPEGDVLFHFEKGQDTLRISRSEFGIGGSLDNSELLNDSGGHNATMSNPQLIYDQQDKIPLVQCRRHRWDRCGQGGQIFRRRSKFSLPWRFRPRS